MTMTEDAKTYAQEIVAAILTLAVIPPVAVGHDPKQVVQRYKEVLDQLRKEDARSDSAG